MNGALNYYTSYGLLRARPTEDDQNCLLRTAYLHYVTRNSGLITSAMAAMSKMNDNGKYAQHPDTTWREDRASHDEITAVIYFLAIVGYTQEIKKIKIGYYLKYPQIIFFILTCKYPWVWPFRFLCGLIMYLGVSVRENASNGRPDTDSELLAMLKIEALDYLGIKLPIYCIGTISFRILKNWGARTLYDKPTHPSFPILITEMLWYDPNHPLYREVIK